MTGPFACARDGGALNLLSWRQLLWFTDCLQESVSGKLLELCCSREQACTHEECY